jgi:hypothetical protein
MGDSKANSFYYNRITLSADIDPGLATDPVVMGQTVSPTLIQAYRIHQIG